MLDPLSRNKDSLIRAIFSIPIYRIAVLFAILALLVCVVAPLSIAFLDWLTTPQL